MALVVLLRKPPEHGRIVHIRFRAAIPVEEKEIAVTVNDKRALALTARKLVRLVSRLLKDNRLYKLPEGCTHASRFDIQALFQNFPGAGLGLVLPFFC